MGSLGTGELIIILVILLVLFGGAKLPSLARSLGKAQNLKQDNVRKSNQLTMMHKTNLLCISDNTF